MTNTADEKKSLKGLDWWQDARFGLFIHWGLYSMLGGVWRGKTWRSYSEWIMYWAVIRERVYSHLAGKFNPTRFDATEWVQIAKRTGMKYIVVTAKHHDGFCLFKSNLTEYNVVDATPFKRDILLELSKACKKEGIKLCLYYSILDWHRGGKAAIFMKYKDFPGFLKYIKGQLKELLTNYGPIGLIFFDGAWIEQWNYDIGKEIEAYCKSIQPQVLINNRVSKRPYVVLNYPLAPWLFVSTNVGDYDTPEQYVPARAPDRAWETNMTMNKSFGFKSMDRSWKSAEVLIKNLVHSVSKGGNFLLNVGPNVLGKFPDASMDRLREISDWFEKNGESIYGSGKSFLGKQKWGWVTQKSGMMYLHVSKWPRKALVVKGLKMDAKSAHFLSSSFKTTLEFEKDGDDLKIFLPKKAPDLILPVIALAI